MSSSTASAIPDARGPATAPASVAPQPPEEYICPISYEVMTDPVIASDGQTYDRPALLQWLAVRQISPLTNEPITADSLVRNYALKSAIERWRASQDGGAASAPLRPCAAPPQRTFQLWHNGQNAWICPENDEALETIVILMLDNSGSMGDPGARELATEGGTFSRNDLTRHSASTVAAMLAERNSPDAPCYLAIGKFSDSASLVMPIREMNQQGLELAKAALKTIQPTGCTNVWDGLRVAMDTAARAARLHPHANIQIFFLTDGEPSVGLLPLEGIQKSLSRKIGLLNVPMTINAFGFGYSLDTHLLKDIAELGGGTYGYIPDCRMAGTVFVHAVANALAVTANNVRIRWMGSEYVLGGLQAGQTKSFLLDQPWAGGATTEVEVAYGNSGQIFKSVLEKVGKPTVFEDACLQVYQLVSRLLAANRWLPSQLAEVQELRDALKKFEGLGPASGIPALLADLDDPDENKGQIAKAVSRADWYGTWGKNQLASYALSLARQQCPNFKDQALQHFLRPRTLALREMGSTLFDTLEAPIPSIKSWSGAASTAPQSMAAYNNATDGCFTGYTPILMANGKEKYASEIKPGDRVAGGHRVLCRVQTYVGKKVPILNLLSSDGKIMSVTPWHPVRRLFGKSTWQFPADLASVGEAIHREEMLHYVYNFVLESGHKVQTGEWIACTLGHGLEGPVIGHDYFGTNRVLDDLRQKPGWAMGYVNVNADDVRRDPETGHVVGI